MIEAFCNKLTFLIQQNVEDIDDEKAEIINFGLHSMISEITKTLGIIIVAYILDVLDLAILTMVCTGIAKKHAGGFHANTHIKCFLTSVILVFGNIFVSKGVGALPNWIALIILVFDMLAIWLYAPADVESKPIINKEFRKELRTKSFLDISLIFLISITTQNPVISNIILFSTFIACAGLTPFVYRLTGCKYSNGVIPDDY